MTVFQSGSLTHPLETWTNSNTGTRIYEPGAHASATWSPASQLGADLILDPQLVHEGQWWRIFTAALVHVNPTHLLLNLVINIFLGCVIERYVGSWAMAGLVLASAAGGALACLLMDPHSAMAGASTVGFGLFAALIGVAKIRGQDLRGPIVLLLVNLGYSMLTEGTSLWAHVGGAVAGAAMTAAYFSPARKNATVITAALIVALTLWVGLVWQG